MRNRILFFLIVFAGLLTAGDLSRSALKGRIKRFAVGRYYEGKLHSRSITVVDEKGNFSEVHTFDQVKKTGKMVYRRDTDGKLIEIRYLTPSGILKYRVVYQYSNKALPASSVYYSPDGTINQTTAYVHDSDGRILSMTGFTPDQKKIFEVYHTYDSNGRLTSSRHLNYAGKLFYQVSYEYEKTDAKGNWTRRLRKTWSLQNKLLGTEVEKRVFEYR